MSLQTEVSNPQPSGHRQPRMSMNVAQDKIVNLLKPFLSSAFVFLCVFNVWPKASLLPMWPWDTKVWTPMDSQSCIFSASILSNTELTWKKLGVGFIWEFCSLWQQDANSADMVQFEQGHLPPWVTLLYSTRQEQYEHWLSRNPL